MNKTINRRPISIPIPTSRERYFNHLEWKGINNHKNVMGVDQQTFIDADNVYIGTDNVLTSRPPVTMRENWGLSGDIVNLWTFGEHMVVQTLSDDIYRIHFVYQDELIEIEDDIVDKDITVILLTRKIFVLSASQFSAFDIVENEWERDATKYIYIPGSTEERNILVGDSSIDNYVWTELSTPPWNLLNDKRIYVEIDGEQIELIYQLGLEKALVSPFTAVLNNINQSRIFKARDADVFAFLDGDRLWYSIGGINWTDSLFTYPTTNLELKMVSKNGDGVWFINTNGNSQNVWVFNISGAGADTGWTYPSNDEFSVTATAPGFFTCLDADNQNTWAIHYATTDMLSKRLYYRYSGWTNYRSQGGIPSNVSSSIVNFQLTCHAEAFLGTTYLWCNLAYANTEATVGSNFLNGLAATTVRYAVEVAETDSVVAISTIHRGLYNSTAPWTFPVVNNGRFYQTNRFGTTWFVMRNSYEYKGNIYVYDYGGWYDTDNSPTGTFEKPLSEEEGFTTGQNFLVAGKKIGPGNLNAIMDIDSIITNDSLYLLPYDQELSTTTVTVLANPFPYNIPIANGLRVSPEDYMRRIWSMSSDGGTLYVTNANDVMQIQFRNITGVNYMYFKHWLEWDDIMLASCRDTYVARYDTDPDGVFRWYISAQSGVNNFNFDITGLHLLSNTELAIFMEHEIWISTIQQADVNLYYYVKSKLPIGVRQGSDIMTTFDGRYILFSCERGLVALQYQQFMATTEQALTFISDNIQATYDEFNTGPIKLYQYKYWVVIYRKDREQFYLLDMRNQSWWTWTLKKPAELLVTYNEKPLSLSDGNLFVLDKYDNYTDDGDEIKWVITSQLLHFDAINNFKQVLSFILNSVDTDDKFVFSLQNINYRRESNTRKREVFEYDIDTVRTFIKRMQFSKVNEFQYQMRNADKSFSPVPLRLTDISIKYIVTERVR